MPTVPESVPGIPVSDAIVGSPGTTFHILKEAHRQGPERAARALRIGMRTGLDERLIEDSLDDPLMAEIETEIAQPNFDPAVFRKTSEPLYQLLSSHPDYLSIVRDGNTFEKLRDLTQIFFRKDDPTRPLADKEKKRHIDRAVALREEKLRKLAAIYGPSQVGETEEGRFTTAERVAQETEKLEKEDAFVINPEKVGFVEGLSLEIPIFSFLEDAVNSVAVYEAAKRIEANEATEDDLDLVFRVARVQDAAERRGVSIPGRISQIVSHAPGIMAEFALTGGAASGARIAVEKTLQTAFKKVLKGHVRKFTRQALGTALGSAPLRTATVGVPRIIGKTFEGMTPGVTPTADEEGNLGVALDPSQADGAGEAFAKALGSEYIQTLSESTGLGAQKLVGSLKRVAMTRWLKLNPKEEVSGFLKKVQSTVGWNGVAGEVFEERAAEYAEDIVGIAPRPELTFDQLAAEVVGFGLIGAPGMAAELGTAKRAPQVPRMPRPTRPEDFLKMGEIITDMDVRLKSPEASRHIYDIMGKDQVYHLPVEAHIEYWKAKKDVDGNLMDPKEVAINLGVKPEVYDQAVKHKTDLAVPSAKYFEFIAPTEHNAWFAQEAKKDPLDQNPRQAEEAKKEEAAEPQELGGPPPISPEAAPLAERLKEGEPSAVAAQLAERLTALNLGRRVKGLKEITPQHIEYMAAVVADSYEQRAKVLGITPEELFERENLTVALGKTPPEGAMPQPTDEQAEAAFHKLAEDIWLGRKKPDQPVPIDRTPAVLQMLGAKPIPVVINAQAITKARELHGLTLHIVQQIRKQLRDPLMVFDSATEPNSLVVLTEFEVDKKPVVAAVHLDERQGFFEVNRIASIHAKDEPGSVGSWVDKGLLRYWDVEKAKPWLLSRGLQLPKENTKASSRKIYTKDDLVKSGLEQPGKRGFTTRLKDRILLAFTKHADFSTWLHEVGHVWLIQLGSDVATLKSIPADALNPAQKAFLERSDGLLEFLGAKDFASITKAQHEKFAEQVEEWFATGKAPSGKLKKAFAEFKSWMFRVYRGLRGKVPIDPRVSDVLERLLASQEELELARQEQSMGGDILEQAVEFLGPEKGAEFAKVLEDAKASQDEKLDAKVLKAARIEKDKGYRDAFDKERKSVEREVNGRAEYVIHSIMTTGAMPDGTPVPEALGGLKLNREALGELSPALEKAIAKDLLTKEGGLTPDMAAEQLTLAGYPVSSGAELANILTNLENKDALIDRLTQERMKALYGDILDDEAGFLEEVMRAAHTPESAKLLQAQAEWMASEEFSKWKGFVQGLLPKPRKLPEITREAEEELRKYGARGLNPRTYQSAEREAGRKALKAFHEGKWKEAFEAVQLQLLNHERFRIATRMLDEIEEMAKYGRSFQRPLKRERLARSGYLEPIETITEKVDFKRRSPKSIERRESLRAFAERHKKETGMMPLIPEKLLEEAYQRNFRDIPYEELLGIRDALKNLDHLGELKYTLLASKHKREFEARRDAAVKSIEEGTPKKRESFIGAKPALLAAQDAGAGFIGYARKLSNFIEEMEGWQVGGPLWDIFVRPLNEAAVAEAAGLEEAAQGMKKLTDLYPLKERHKLFKKEYEPAIDVSLSRMDRIMIALNWGNLGNRERLKDGYGWTDAQVQAIIDKLDDTDLKFIQGVFDLINSHWPQIEALMKDVDGVAHEKVEAMPISTSAGTIPGGYFPIRHIDKSSYVSPEEALERAMRGAAVRSQTRHDHRKARGEGQKKEILLEPRVIFEHLSSVIHDLTHYKALIDAHRLLNDPKLRATIEERFSPAALKEIRHALDDIARGEIGPKNAFEKVLAFLRRGTSTLVMAWRVLTASKQPLGLISSTQYLGPKWMKAGLMRFGSDAIRMENAVRWVHEKSEFMRLRHKTTQREIAEERNKLSPDALGGILAAPKEVLEKINDQGYWLIGKFQMLADVPTWIGAYEKALSEAGSPRDAAHAQEIEDRAVQLADQAVIDTQGSGYLKDMSHAQRSSIMRSLLMFYTFANARLNRTLQAFGKVKSVKDVPKLLSDLLVLYWVPITLTNLAAYMTGNDDDEEKLKERILRSGFAEMLGDLPLFREAAGTIQGYPYRGPAVFKIIPSSYQAIAGMFDEEGDRQIRKPLIEATGILFHYPGQMLNDIVGGIEESIEEERFKLKSILFGPEPKRK